MARGSANRSARVSVMQIARGSANWSPALKSRCGFAVCGAFARARWPRPARRGAAEVPFHNAVG
jgi:hypothetical protein